MFRRAVKEDELSVDPNDNLKESSWNNFENKNDHTSSAETFMDNQLVQSERNITNTVMSMCILNLEFGIWNFEFCILY